MVKPRTAKRIDKLVKLFEQHHPKNCLEAETVCGVTFTPLPKANGAFRDVYTVKGYPIVVKFPNGEGGSKKHSRAEIRTVRTILKSKYKYKVLHKYMPKIYYGNTRTGVIIMKKYELYHWSSNEDRYAIALLLEELCDEVWPYHHKSYNKTADIAANNIGKNDDAGHDGYPVIIDLGYFLPEGHDADSF